MKKEVNIKKFMKVNSYHSHKKRLIIGDGVEGEKAE